jgi:hypothetical protein
MAMLSFDTLAFIALILVAGFFRLIAKQAEKAKRNSEDDGRKQPVARQSAEETDEQRVRRFLEALGQPTSRPPPRVERRLAAPAQKRAAFPRGRTISSPLPALTTAPPPLPVEVQEPAAAAPPPLPTPMVIPGVPTISAARNEISKSAPIVFPDTTHRALSYPEIWTMLSSERGLRDAMILREILGPPRSMQTLDF